MLGKLRNRYWKGRRWAAGARSQLSQHGAQVRRTTGKGTLAQLLDMARLGIGGARLTPEEYYFLQLYDDSRYPWNEKRRFIGYWFERALRHKLKMDGWYVIANDKVVQSMLLDGQGIPTPRSFAVFHPTRQVARLTTLPTSRELAEFLLERASGGMVLKPIYGARGKSVFLIETIDQPTRMARLATGEALSIESLIDKLQDPWGEGFLLQELLKPHPDVAQVSGGQLCCARIIMLVDREGARPWRCVWRLPAPDSMVDNVSQEGNLIATVDTASGAVRRVVLGHGPGMSEVIAHPRTGASLQGFHIPDWQTARELCIRAASLFPSFHIQAWDIALTTRGPVVLEVNPVGGAVGHQLAYQKGFLQPDMEAFLAKLGAL